MLVKINEDRAKIDFEPYWAFPCLKKGKTYEVIDLMFCKYEDGDREDHVRFWMEDECDKESNEGRGEVLSITPYEVSDFDIVDYGCPHLDSSKSYELAEPDDDRPGWCTLFDYGFPVDEKAAIRGESVGTCKDCPFRQRSPQEAVAKTAAAS